MSAEFRDMLGAGYFEEYPTPQGHYLRADAPAKALLLLISRLAYGFIGVSLMAEGGVSVALQSREAATSSAKAVTVG